MLALLADREVGIIVFRGVQRLLHVRSVIDKRFDRKFAGQVDHASGVIAVVMGQHQKIDLRKAGLLGYAHNAVGIARAGPTGIHQ